MCAELLRDGFGEECYFKVLLVELISPPPLASNPTNTSPVTPPPRSANMEKDESLIGYALYFFNYSTWEGRILYLEDLYIRTAYRSEFTWTIMTTVKFLMVKPPCLYYCEHPQAPTNGRGGLFTWGEMYIPILLDTVT